MTLKLTFLTGTALALATAAHAELLVFDYAGFENPDFHTAFTAKHGKSPDFTFFGDEDEAFQKLSSGFKADVTQICAGSVNKFTESGLLAPWDTSKLEQWGNLNADLAGEQIAGQGNVYFLPIVYGSTAIAYNTEEVPAEDVASLDVFLNPAYAGRMTLPDNVDDAYALGYLATGTTNWQNATPEQFAAASDWLRQAHANLRTYWTDPAELSQLLASGEVVVSWAWNETLPTMVDEGFPIGFQREAAEGSSLWLCGYAKLADGTGASEDLIYDYVNAFLDESSTTALLDAGFGQSNATAMAAKGEDALTASGLGEISAPILAQLPMDGRLREMQAVEFEKIKAGF